jgi:RNA polymerase sigma factor (sigma-70 family)
MHADHRYIEALRRNDERVIREIYQLHADKILRWVQSRGGAADDAQDIFQEALIALFEKAKNADFVLTCPLGAMLHIICSNKWIDRMRQKGRDSGVRKAEEARYTHESEGDALVQAEDIMAEHQRHTRLRVAFYQLSELCQQLLNLLSEGKKPAEAASILQMNSAETVHRRKNACTERWRELYHGLA